MWFQLDAACEFLLELLDEEARGAPAKIDVTDMHGVLQTLAGLPVTGPVLKDKLYVEFHVESVRLRKLRGQPRPVMNGAGKSVMVTGRNLGVVARVRPVLTGLPTGPRDLPRGDLTMRADARPLGGRAIRIEGDYESFEFVDDVPEKASELSGLKSRIDAEGKKMSFDKDIDLEKILAKLDAIDGTTHQIANAALAPRGWGDDPSRVTAVIDLAPNTVPDELFAEVWGVYLDSIFQTVGALEDGQALGMTIWHDLLTGTLENVVRKLCRDNGLTLKHGPDVTWRTGGPEDMHLRALVGKATVGVEDLDAPVGVTISNLSFDAKSGLRGSVAIKIGDVSSDGGIFGEFVAWVANKLKDLVLGDDGTLRGEVGPFKLDAQETPFGTVVPVGFTSCLFGEHFRDDAETYLDEVPLPVNTLPATLPLLPQPGAITFQVAVVPALPSGKSKGIVSKQWKTGSGGKPIAGRGTQTAATKRERRPMAPDRPTREPR